VTRPAPVDARAAASTLGERIVVLFLVAAAIALGWIRFKVVPARGAPSAQAFDLRNPMLQARVGDCVEVESTQRPGVSICFRVEEPGLVLRPHLGPDHLGPDRDLKRARPYLVTVLWFPPEGQGCDVEAPRRQIERFDLNDFGMPSSVEVELASLRPRWVRRGERQYFAYEAVLMRYGPGGGPWITYVAPEAPVTGALFRVNSTPRGDTHWTVFRDCR
jgi:hypothetical protein